MAKNKGAVEDDVSGEGTAEAEVAVTGKGKSVEEALKKAGLKHTAKDLKGQFGELLKDPTNKIICQRVLPRSTRDPQTGKVRDCDDLVELPPPMTRDEIVQHLKEEFGGRKWNIRIVDEDGDVLGAQNIDVPGEPKLKPSAMDEFEIPTGLDDEIHSEGPKEENDPLADEIDQKAKQGKALQLERQNAMLRREIEELKSGWNGQKVDVQAAIAQALKEAEDRHRREIETLKRDQEKSEMERRITESTSRQIAELRSLIEKNGAGREESSTTKDLLHRIEMMQTNTARDIKDAMAAVEKASDQKIGALERSIDAKLTALQTTLTQLMSRPPDNPIKDVVPLITSSIERSTSGYKEIIQPLMQYVSRKPEEVERGNDLLETVQTLQALGVVPGANKDFTNRVMDLLDKAAPEIFDLVRKKQAQGEEITKDAIRNHLKLAAAKISEEVSAVAAREIRQIAAQKGLGGGQPQGLPAPKGAAPQPAKPAASSPVGKMSEEEVARRVRPERPPVVEASPAQAPASPPRPAPRAAPPVEPAPEPEPETEGVEEEADEPMTVEEEMADRVDATLEVLEREMKIRPREITWPKFAWDTLPGQVLDQIIYANDEEDVYNAVKPLADPGLCERIWQLIRSDPKAKDFIVAGINIIKAWAVELQAKQREAAEALRKAREAASGQVSTEA